MEDALDYFIILSTLLTVDKIFRVILCKPTKLLIGLIIGNELLLKNIPI